MKIRAILLLCLSAFTAEAQIPIRLNAYLNEAYLQNPAASSMDSATWKYDLYLQHKFLPDDTPVWQKNPQISASIHHQKNKNIFSFLYFYDAYSYFTLNSLNLGYSRMLSAGNWEIQPAIRVGTSIVPFDLHPLHLPDVTGQDKELDYLFHIDLGARFKRRNLEVQFAYNNLGNSTIVRTYELMRTRPYWLGNIRYHFQIGQRWEINPFVQIYHETISSFDLGAQIGLKDKLTYAYSFRIANLNSFHALNYRVNPQFSLRASYGNSLLYADQMLEIGFTHRFYK